MKEGHDKMIPMPVHDRRGAGGWRRLLRHRPGPAWCFTRGSTIDECRERAIEAIEVHIAGLQADGEPVPDEVGAPRLLAVTVAG
jgi:predicted RNase H-like HicB family nuclease